jgi:hypothetical protein
MMRKQRSFLNTISTSIVGILMLIVTYQAQAGIIIADAYFTLRSEINAGPVVRMDVLGGPTTGILGLLTNSENTKLVDHTHWEFDMSTITGPVSSATLDWTWSFSQGRPDVISVDVYSADGQAATTDWLAASDGPLTFLANLEVTSFDITSVINANLTESYLGFSLNIDESPGQGFFGNRSDPMTLNFTTNVPEPGTLALMALGLVGLGFKHRHTSTHT